MKKLIINKDDKNSPLSSSNIIYTIIIFLIHMTYGISIASFGPTYVDLKNILQTSINKISIAPIFLSLGYLTGSLFGFLYNYVNRQLTTIVLTTLMAVSYALVPFSQNIWQLYLFIYIYAIGAGSFVFTKNVWLLEIWQHNSGLALQICGFMYGIGNILGPLIDRPFVTGDLDLNELNNTLGYSIELDTEAIRYKLKFPFLLVGIAQLLGPALLAVMYLVKRYDTQPEYQTDLNDTQLFERTTEHRKLFLVLSAVFLAFYVSTETVYTQFAATYFQYIPLRLTAQQSTAVVSVMSLTYTISIGISSLVSLRLGTERIIFPYFLILFVGLLILVFVQNSSLLLWIGSLTMSFGLSPIYPSIYAYIGQHIRITNKIGTILYFFSEALNLIEPFLLGYYIEMSPNVFIWSLISNIFVIFIAFIFISQVIRIGHKIDEQIHSKTQLVLKYDTFKPIKNSVIIRDN